MDIVTIMFVIGLLIGIIATTLFIRLRSVGTLRIDRSDPEDGPYLFLELTSRPEEVAKKAYITLRVDLESYISHK